MKKLAPTVVGEFTLDTSNSTEPGASYKSPQMVYDTLNPTSESLREYMSTAGRGST